MNSQEIIALAKTFETEIKNYKLDIKDSKKRFTRDLQSKINTAVNDAPKIEKQRIISVLRERWGMDQPLSDIPQNFKSVNQATYNAIRHTLLGDIIYVLENSP